MTSRSRPTGNDLDWMSRGHCNGMDLRIFYPERGESTKVAKDICASCPVLTECLGWALKHEHFGVWGGLSEEERAALRRKNRLAKPASKLSRVAYAYSHKPRSTKRSKPSRGH